MINALKWATKEIEKASKTFTSNKFFYESALKAYKSLLNDEPNTLSWGIIFNALQRLCLGLPLTPIEDNDGQWVLIEKSISDENKDKVVRSYYHNRHVSLIKNRYYEKEELKDTVFDDISRIKSFNDLSVKEPDCVHSLFTHLINKLFPISFPYMPSTNPYQIIYEGV